MAEEDPALPLQRFSEALSGLVSRASSRIVSIHSHRSRASGFIWRPGLVVTASEALAEEGEITVVLAGGSQMPATLAGRDPATDIALLRIDNKDLGAAPLATDPVAAGALSLVVGAYEGAPVAALGVVALASGAWRSLRGGAIDARIELDLSLRRSSEGGLAFDARGRALGMAVFGPRRRVLVIPSATVERVAAKLEAYGKIARGYLGLGLQPVRLDDGGMGLMVMSADAHGPGAAAGLRQGDVVTAWNGEPVKSLNALLRALGPDSIGTSLKLSVRRGGEPIEVAVTIRERPDA